MNTWHQNKFIMKTTNLTNITNHTLRMLFLLILGTLASNNTALAATYYSVDSGNWQSSNKWSLISGGSSCGSCTPGATDNAIIENGQTINITGSGADVNNITISISSTLTMSSSGDLNVNGNFINNGTFSVGSNSTVTFQGANTQSITGITTFNDLIINKTTANNTVVLNNNIIVEKTLTLTAGLLVTQNNEISLNGAFNDQLDGAPFGLTNHVVTSANGKFLREDVSISAGITAVVFPISATTTDYAPLSITNNTTSTINYGNITAGVRASGTAIPALSVFVNSIWNIAISGSTAAIMTFSWNNATNLVGVLPSTTTVKQSNGAPTPVWTPISTTPYVLLAPSITAIVPAGTGINRDFAVFAVTATLPSTIFVSLVSGNWANGANWATSPNLTISCNCLPLANADITIRTGHTLTVNLVGDVASGISVTIENGGTLSLETTVISAFTLLNLNAVAGAKIIAKNNVLPIVTNTNTFATANTTVVFAGNTAFSVPVGFIGFETDGYQNLSISGTNAKTLSNDIVINGTLLIDNNATLDAGTNRQITLKKNWTNNGTFVARNGIITLVGANTQTIEGTSVSPTFYTLLINNSNNVTLNNAVAVAGTFTLTNGKLIANAAIKLTNIPSSQLGITFGTNNYVVTNAPNGRLIRNGLLTTTAYSFPIGTDTKYTPATITTTNAIANISASVVAATSIGLGNPVGFVPYIWHIYETAQTPLTLTAKFNWNVGDATGLTPDTKAQRLQGTPQAWTQAQSNYFTTSPNEISVTNVALTSSADRQFAVFVALAPIVPPVPLPQLATPNTNIKFVGINENNPNMVEFSWLPVVGAQGYEIRLGTNENNIMVWKTAMIMGFITNPLLISYQNKNIEYDVTTYYSVKATATTGASNSGWSSPAVIFVSSINDPTTALNTDIQNQIKLSPNPTNGFFMLNWGDVYGSFFKDNHITFILTDATGKVFLTDTTTQGFPYKMSLESVPSALYYLKIVGKEGIVVKKISKI